MDEPNDWVPVEQTQPKDDWVPSGPPATGASEALGRGLAKGATFNWYDELRGLAEAGGAEQGHGPLGVSHVLMGAFKKLYGDEGAQQLYNTAVARERAKSQLTETEHPYASAIGEVGGALATAPLLPIKAPAAVPGASKLYQFGQQMAHGAELGAAAGALGGAGEAEGGVGETLAGGLTGGITGGAMGALSVPAAKAAGAVGGFLRDKVGRPIYDAFGRPVVNTFRGMRDPETTAAQLVGREGLQADVLAHEKAQARYDEQRLNALLTGNPLPPNGPPEYRGLTSTQWTEGAAAGAPVRVIDAGADATRALARTAANISTEARGELLQMLEKRSSGQTERMADFIKSLVHSPANANLTREELENMARAANKPLYDRAFKDGRSLNLDAEFQDIMKSPHVQQAMNEATRFGATHAVANRYTPIKNPFTFDEQGVPHLTDPNVKPSLQYWDYVKQILDSTIRQEGRLGGDTGIIRGAKNRLVEHLDNLVPAYRDARGTAAGYFRADNAVEAGEKAFADTKLRPDAVKKLMAKMNPVERDMFREGYASKWYDKYFNLNKNADLTKRDLNSIRQEEMPRAVMGDQAMRSMEALFHRERWFERAKNALAGGSSTTRELLQAHALAGLTGGALGAGIGGSGGAYYDPSVSGFLSGAAKGATIGAGAKAAGKALQIQASREVMKHVGSILAGNDFDVVHNAMKMAGRHPAILNTLRDISSYIPAVAGEQGGGYMGRAFQAPDQPQQRERIHIPGPPTQHASGGRVASRSERVAGTLKRLGVG